MAPQCLGNLSWTELLNVQVSEGLLRRVTQRAMPWNTKPSNKEITNASRYHNCRVTIDDSLLHSTQSAMNTFVSCPPPLLRLLQKTIFLPSGENIGKAS